MGPKHLLTFTLSNYSKERKGNGGENGMNECTKKKQRNATEECIE